MTTLTAKQQSFIEMMQANNELAWKDFIVDSQHLTGLNNMHTNKHAHRAESVKKRADESVRTEQIKSMMIRILVLQFCRINRSAVAHYG
jgi:hypothetical protein